MAYEAVVRRYLRELEREYNSAVRGGQHTGELSYRAPMHEFFKALARELNPAGSFDIILEPKRQLRVGRSDWRVHDSVSLGIYGYIEAKPLTVDPLDLGPHRSQIDKYLSLGHKLVITDGIDFVFAFPGREAVTVQGPAVPAQLAGLGAESSVQALHGAVFFPSRPTAGGRGKAGRAGSHTHPQPGR